jgi:lysophospholipase L1-like esterase
VATLPNPGPLAQLVEQGTLNPKVEGSNPSRPTLQERGQADAGKVGIGGGCPNLRLTARLYPEIVRFLRFFVLGALAIVPVAAAQPPAIEARSAAACGQTSTGLVPLTDLGKRRYKGHRGGLYPSGLNQPPRFYLRQGQAAAKRVRPISGRVVLLSIGMSNTTQEFRAFMGLATGDAQIKPTVKLVDGAMGGWDARRVARPGGGYWPALDRRLRAEGVSPLEVQAVWLKEAIAGEDRPFPQDARALRANLRAIVQILARRFPNLRLIYPSSRTYAGYAVTALNPEPAAYDSGFAVRWLIQDRMQGKLKGPWIGWGPYLWTDGERGRADGLVWKCEDVRKDGTHPSATGAAKVARALLQFFKSDPTAKTWFTTTG